VNVKKLTIVWFVVPLLLVMLDAIRGHNIMSASDSQAQQGENIYVRLCRSLTSPTGYAATWALALFLIPVTKHSPILDWLRVTPVQALAFHRVAGWTSFWYSVLHGFLELQRQMDYFEPQQDRTRLEQLKPLLVPSSWRECLGTQNPWHVFWGYQEKTPEHECRRVLVNGTGFVSCVAFALLAVTSLPSFRRKFYTVFYVVHIPTAWIMLINAIWHYPKCSLIMIPNIMYYLSFNIPIYVNRAVERWIQWRQSKKIDGVAEESSALVEANLIQGGSIELTFATTSEDQRHESSYVKVFFPEVSLVSHPFSTFSRASLVNAGCNGPSSSTTKSILLRSKGPFTKGLKKALFPDRSSASASDLHLIPENDDGECAFPPTPEAQVGDPLPALSSSHHKIQFDSYYAGSFDWIGRAMASHDEILIIAGGVGIVPFLDFLPSLQRRIQTEHECRSEQCLEVENPVTGPKRIHLHWYCREVGLASYIWHKYLHPQVHKAWENNSACQDRLKIHIHLTSLKPSSSMLETGEILLASIPDLGVAEKIDVGVHQQQDTIRPVQDARFMQSMGLRLLGPGLLVVISTGLYWWWYTQFVLSDQFRHSNYIIRSYSVVFSLVLAVVVSIIVEVYLRYYKDDSLEYTSLSTGQKGDKEEGSVVEMAKSHGAQNSETAVPASGESLDVDNNVANPRIVASMGAKMDSDFLEVKRGRPCIDTVIQGVLKAKKPGVFSCGSRTLLDTVEESICLKRDDCAFYEEDSEM